MTVGDVDVDIGANPSAEEADEGTESSSRKVVDVVDSFRLVVSWALEMVNFRGCCTNTVSSISVCCDRSNQVMTRKASWATLRYSICRLNKACSALYSR